MDFFGALNNDNEIKISNERVASKKKRKHRMVVGL